MNNLIKNASIRKIGLGAGSFKTGDSVEPLLNIVKRILKELEVPYVDECCNEIHKGSSLAETDTFLNSVTLTDGILSIQYTGENGTPQIKTADLTALIPKNSIIDGSYDEDTNTLTLEKVDGTTIEIPINELTSLTLTDTTLTFTDENGVANEIDLTPAVKLAETTTVLKTFSLSGTNLTLVYTDEDGVDQQKIVDLISLRPTLTTTGNSGPSTYESNVLNIPNYSLAGLGGQPLSTNLTSLSGLNYVSPSFIKMTATGTFTLDTNDYYLASNPNGYTTNIGTVTSVGGTGTVSGLTLTGSVTTTGDLILGGTLSVLPSNFASQVANTVLAAPNGSAGTPTFRTLASTDIPSLDASKITSGIIDSARLPSYVDDVIEAASLVSFPTTGETGKIYVALDTNKTYRWGGSSYIYITSGAVDSVGGFTGVVTAGQLLTALLTVDGPGSLLDADTLDGLDSTAFYLASNPSGYTNNIGTVTSVNGTGTVSGLTLSGAVTGSGNLTLSGSLVLTSGQITAGLGYTPYNSTNPDGYITSSSLLWTNISGRPTALSSFTNDLGNYGGWITGINSSMVTTALGYIPYNSTNPNGYTSNTGTVTGTGVVNYVARWASATGLTTGVIIDNGTNVLIGGTVDDGNKLQVTGNTKITGSITATNGGFNSDIKDKTDLIYDGKENILDLKGVSYLRKSTNKKEYGYIAQDVEKVLPEAVYETVDGLAVSYHMVNAAKIQALQNEVIELKKLVHELKLLIK
jgi:hypothetical protein